MDDNKFKDKYAFIVAFLAVVLAFSAFRPDLERIPFFESNLFVMVLVFAGTLTLSAYIYALVFAIDQLVKSTQLLKLKEWGVRIANFVYFIGIIFPIGVLLIFFINFAIGFFGGGNPGVQGVASALAGIVGGAFGVFIASKYSAARQSQEKSSAASRLNDFTYSTIKQATLLYSQKFYDAAVVEAFKVVESSLLALIKSKFYMPGNISSLEAIQFAQQQGLISKYEVDILHNIRKIRNKAAHGKFDDSHEAKKVLGAALDLAQLFDTRAKVGEYSDEEVSK